MIAKSSLKIVHGQRSWTLATPQVRAHVTEIGGHLGPVRFNLNGKHVEPYSVAPWATEERVQQDRKTPNIIKVLRGDFFCMPFGGNATKFGREQHPVHGECANQKWRFVAQESTLDGDRRLRLSMRTKIRPARIEKLIELRKGHHAVYCRDIVSSASGPMTIGHHAMLKFPDDSGCGVISTSRFVYGQVFPEPVERPESLGYSMLEPGAEFDSLERVPTITRQTTDLSRYPARRGFEDLVMLVSDPVPTFAWTAVTFAKQRFVWFAIKDPRVLRSTILWISNGGRHYAPWSSRHVNVMGLEEVTANFHYGLAESANDNPLSKRRFETTVQLDPERPLIVNYIMAVAAIPSDFSRVARIERHANETVRLTSDDGREVDVRLDVGFLQRTEAQE